jgi:hypothetical protein
MNTTPTFIKAYNSAAQLFPFPESLHITPMQTPLEFSAIALTYVHEGRLPADFADLSPRAQNVFVQIYAACEDLEVPDEFTLDLDAETSTAVTLLREQLNGSITLISDDTTRTVAHHKQTHRTLDGVRWSDYQITNELRRVAQTTACAGNHWLAAPSNLIAFLRAYPVPEMWHEIVTGSNWTLLSRDVLAEILLQPACDAGTAIAFLRKQNLVETLEAARPVQNSLIAQLKDLGLGLIGRAPPAPAFEADETVPLLLIGAIFERAIAGGYTSFFCDPGFDGRAYLKSEIAKFRLAGNTLGRGDHAGWIAGLEALMALDFRPDAARDVPMRVTEQIGLSLAGPSMDSEGARPARPVTDNELEALRAVVTTTAPEQVLRGLADKVLSK